MLALGLCNIFGSFVRSMPTTGSFTRTAVNNASGVKTPMGGVITGCLVLLACGLLTSTFAYIPKATLAAVIIIAMYYMLEVHIFVVLWRTKSKTTVIPRHLDAFRPREKDVSIHVPRLLIGCSKEFDENVISSISNNER